MRPLPTTAAFVALTLSASAHANERFVDRVPNRATFDALAERQPQSFAQGSAELKFLVSERDGEPVVWFFNSRRWKSHYTFARSVLRLVDDLDSFRRGAYFTDARRFIAGEIVAHDAWRGPGGQRGVYTLSFWPADTIDAKHVALAYRLVSERMPFAQIRYHPSGVTQQRLYAEQRERYEASAVPVISTDELFAGRDFAALNTGQAIGTLRLLGAEPPERPPGFRDIVVYRYAPNDLPHVAGVLTCEPQTPLSHINLVARQNGTPNAYLRGATDDPRITGLAGELVRLVVRGDGYTLEPVSAKDAERHYAQLRPRRTQRPRRSLGARKIEPLRAIRFKDRHAFGAKAVSVAELGRVDGVRAPDGFGVPFYFYDRFMELLGFYDEVEGLLEQPRFRDDAAYRQQALRLLRERIEDAQVPAELALPLEAMHAEFPAGRPLRCRSSANHEDLEGFSGAGLYDSCTHRPDEGSITKSIKQVWASLWTYRAFEEREFWRIDHRKAAMGVLVHPNFDDELANGVAVTKNLLAPQWEGTYVNVQRGEQDSITNPLEAQPEALVVAAIGQVDTDPTTANGRGRELVYLRRSSLVGPDETVLSREQAIELDKAARAIHQHFARLYRADDDADFALDLEFKIDAAGDLVFKQARPWVD